MNASDISIAFEPLLPWWAIAVLGVAGLLLLLVLWARRARGRVRRADGAEVPCGLGLGAPAP